MVRSRTREKLLGLIGNSVMLPKRHVDRDMHSLMSVYIDDTRNGTI